MLRPEVELEVQRLELALGRGRFNLPRHRLRVQMLAGVFESLIGEVTSPHVATDNMLASGVFDAKLCGRLDYSEPFLYYEFDKLSARFIRNTSIVAAFEAAPLTIAAATSVIRLALQLIAVG